MHAPSAAEQDYLKQIYRLQEETGRATTQELATRLGVDPRTDARRMREPAPRHRDPDDLRGVVRMRERERYRPADTPEAAELDDHELVLDPDDPPQALLVSGNHPVTLHFAASCPFEPPS